MKEYMDNEFDLIVVIAYFRSALPILSIVKYIKEIKIGVLYADSSKDINNKVDIYQNKFRNLLLYENNTHLCKINKNYKTNILIIQQSEYEEEYLESISKNISYEKSIALLGYRMGYKKNDLFLDYFKIDICAINDINLYYLFKEKRKCSDIYDNYKIIEVGLPYLKYEPFHTPNIDWIIASPTTFSFETEEDITNYLNTIISILSHIDKSKIIAYKSHNGNKYDYLDKYSCLIKLIPYRNIIIKFLNKLKKMSPRKLNQKLTIIINGLLQKKIKQRTIDLNEISNFHYLPIEAFIPKVQEGIIGGNSNMMWGALFYKKKIS